VSHPDLSTPLGRAWLIAARIAAHGMRDAPELLRDDITQLAQAVKVLCELIEQEQARR